MKQNVLESQLLRYFSRAFELVRQHPGEPVLKYAVRRLSEANFAFAASLVQRLAFQAAAVDPGTLHTALYIAFEQRERFGATIDRPALTKALGSIIQRHAPLQHGGDIAWALWGAVVFDVLIGSSAVEALERLTDPVAILMALHAEQEGKLARSLTRSHWESQAISPELFDSKWLLVYEGVGQDWLKPLDGDPALSDPFFADARAHWLTGRIYGNVRLRQTLGRTRKAREPWLLSSR